MEIKVKNAERLTARIKAVKSQLNELTTNLLDNINYLIDDIEELEDITTLKEIQQALDRAEDFILTAMDLI